MLVTCHLFQLFDIENPVSFFSISHPIAPCFVK